MSDVVQRIRAERDLAAQARDRAATEVARLTAKLTELETALRVLEQYSTTATGELPGLKAVGSAESDVGGTPPGECGLSAEAKQRLRDEQTRGQKRRFITHALADSAPRGLTVAEIEEWILANRGLKVSPNTISVTLPRLREAGIARLDGRHWFYVLPSQAETAGEPIKDSPAGCHSQ